jgi:hypothetical protein
MPLSLPTAALTAALPLLFALLTGCSKEGSSPTEPPPPGGGNHNPTINTNTSTTHLTYGATAQITVSVSDPDGDQVTIAYTATRGTVTSSGPTATTATFTAGSSWGPAAVTATASDGRGGTASAVASMYIRNPDPPRFAVAPICLGTNAVDVRITPQETVLLDQVQVVCEDPYSCGTAKDYSPPQLVNANQTFTAGCVTCSAPSCGSPYRNVFIAGHRPEPDGGAFYVEPRVYFDGPCP